MQRLGFAAWVLVIELIYIRVVTVLYPAGVDDGEFRVPRGRSMAVPQGTAAICSVAAAVAGAQGWAALAAACMAACTVVVGAAQAAVVAQAAA
jgi:hypothetical protein